MASLYRIVMNLWQMGWCLQLSTQLGFQLTSSKPQMLKRVCSALIVLEFRVWGSEYARGGTPSWGVFEAWSSNQISSFLIIPASPRQSQMAANKIILFEGSRLIVRFGKTERQYGKYNY